MFALYGWCFLYNLYYSYHVANDVRFLYFPLLRSPRLPVSQQSLRADLFRECLREYLIICTLAFVIFLLALILHCLLFPYNLRTAVSICLSIDSACFMRASIAHADLDYDGYRFIIELPASVFDGGMTNHDEVNRIRAEKKRAARAKLLLPLKTCLSWVRRRFG